MCFTFSVHPTQKSLAFLERKNDVCSSNLCYYFSDGFSLLKRLVTPISSKSMPKTP